MNENDKAKRMRQLSQAANRYAAKNYDRIELTVPKGGKELLKEAANGESVNRFILKCIEAQTGISLTLDGELPYKRAEQPEK